MRPPTRLRDGLLLALLVLPVAFGQPTFIGISPSGGSSHPGDSVAFSATFDDTAGAADILNAQVYVSLAGGWPATPACNVGYYNFVGGALGLYLVADDGSTLLGPMYPPGTGPPPPAPPDPTYLSNSQCTVSGFTASWSGNNVTVNFTAAFTSNLLGTNDLWGYGTNLAGSYGSWLSEGAWIVAGVPIPAVVTIAISPQSAPIQIEVDGTAISPPKNFNWNAGETHTLAAPVSPPGSSGTEYQLENWSDGGAASHTITVPAYSATYTATYATEFYLTTIVSPPGAGTITPPNWYGSQSQVPISASPAPGYQFTGFSGALSGTLSPQTVTMNGPETVTANFTQIIPTATGITPSSGSSIAGQDQPFSATFFDTSGAADILNAQVYVSSNLYSPVLPACNVGYYEFDSNDVGLYLLSDPDSSGNTTLLGPIWPDTPTQTYSVSNNSCTIKKFTYSWSGNQITVNFTANFTLAFVGQKSLWAYATSVENAYGPWQLEGAWTVSQPGPPDLTITKSHFANFAFGQTGATYTLTVANIGGSRTSGAVTVADTLPSGLTATAIYGPGWTCTPPAGPCTRSDALSVGASYPSITLTVNVAANAPASVTNTATVSGGGESNTSNDTASDPTTLTVGTPDLTISKTHAGMFTQGQTGAQYTITASNAGTGLTTGAVTVTDTLPTGETAAAIAGSGWTCTLSPVSCTRSDSLAPGGSYPPIVLTVNVSASAPASVTNTAAVSGGGESNTTNDTAQDVTAIVPAGTAPPSNPTGISIWGPSAGGSNWVSSGYYYSYPPQTMGLKFRSDAPGVITGIRFYTEIESVWVPGFGIVSCGFPGAGTPTNSVMLYDASGNLLAQAPAGAPGQSNPPQPQWVEAGFSTPVSIQANTTYVAAYATSCGYYQDAGSFTNSGVDNPPLHALRSGVDGVNGVYASGTTFPTTAANGANFWVDVVFVPPPTLDQFTLPPDPTIYIPPNQVAVSSPVAQSKNFSFVFHDANGATDIKNAQVWIGFGGWPGPAPYCHLGYFVSDTGPIGAFDDAGTTRWICPSSGTCSKPGNPTSQSNAQCGVSNFSYSPSGTQLTVNATVSLTGNLAALASPPNVPPNLWYYTTNFENVTTNWSPFGTWAVFSPDLTIFNNPTAINFTQGQTGAQYTITVINNGGAPTSGAVTVNETLPLPTGLTATSIAGSGWTCTQPAGPCSRSDVLGQGGGYPPIILTVNVASNAPTSLTTTATVSGGGDVNTANNTATNQVQVLPALTILTTAMPPANVGAPYSATLTASGGAPPYAWSLAAGSSLPSGLVLNSASGAIMGNPASSGNLQFTVKVTDSSGATATQPLTLAVALPTLSINGGSNTAEVAPSTTVSLAFNLYDQANGANDIAYGQFYLADSSGNANCYGDWGRPNGLDLYDGNTGTTWGLGINQSDSFCTVSLASITNSASDPTEVTVVLNFSFNPGPGGTYTIQTQINYGVGYTGPWEALGTLIVDAGHVTISGHLTASGYPLAGATVNLTGSSSAAATTDNSGSYSFAEIAGGNYTVTPSEGGLAFAPSFLSWNNLRVNQTADFTAVPDDYPAGSGPTSLPNSFAAPDPVLTCDDISGDWDDAGSFGSVGWNLTQTGASITGQMEYDIVRGTTDCGIVTYDVTGSYDGSSSSFSLSATVHGSGYDACGYPVPFTQQTETVTLSGRACGTGSAQFNTTSGSGSTAQIGMVLTRSTPSRPSQRKQDDHGSQVATGESPAIASPPASIAKLRPLDAQGSSSWTTISPRFTVQYSSYIPVDHVSAVTPCFLQLGTSSVVAGGKIYKGDAFQGTYRTTESLLIIPAAQRYTNLFARGGPTRNYSTPTSPANGLFANLSSALTTPTADPWNDPSYMGLDEDHIPLDCYRWNNQGEADNSTMRGVNVTWGNPVTQVNLSGQGFNPLESPKALIQWNLTISLDLTNPSSPKAWVSGGTTTCYPAHIVKVNSTVVYSSVPPQNNIRFIGTCLLGSGSPISPSTPLVVPAY